VDLVFQFWTCFCPGQFGFTVVELCELDTEFAQFFLCQIHFATGSRHQPLKYTYLHLFLSDLCLNVRDGFHGCYRLGLQGSDLMGLLELFFHFVCDPEIVPSALELGSNEYTVLLRYGEGVVVESVLEGCNVLVRNGGGQHRVSM